MNRLQGHRASEEYLVTLNARERIDARQRHRRDGLRAPDLHRRVGRRAAAAAPAWPPTSTVYAGRLPRLGFPRGRLPLGRRGGARTSGSSGERAAAGDRASRRRDADAARAAGDRRGHVPHQRRDRCATASATASTSGSSTSTTLPEPAVVPAPVRRLPGRGPPRRPRRARSRRTSSASWRCTAYGSGTAARVLMLANARVLGHVFDPLTRLLVLRRRRRAGVRRRRGAQHLRRAARLPPAPRRARARASADKEFYVSPFIDLSGRYDMRFTLADPRVGPRPSRCAGGDRVAFTRRTSAARPSPATRPRGRPQLADATR